MRNTLRRQNEAMEGEKKRLKSDYYRRRSKTEPCNRQQRSCHNGGRRVLGITQQNPHCRAGNMEDSPCCIYTGCMIILVHAGQHLRIFFLNYSQIFSGEQEMAYLQWENVQLMEMYCFDLTLWFVKIIKYFAYRVDQSNLNPNLQAHQVRFDLFF